MNIRKGLAQDSQVIARCLMLAMEDIIYSFIKQNNYSIALDFLEELIQSPDNQYSYQNCWVLEDESGVVAVALVYDGACLEVLRQPVALKIKQRFGLDFNPADETQSGEIYIDCIGVLTEAQGKGYGSELLDFLIKFYVIQNQQILGLLVDEENYKAKKLYLKKGFKKEGDKVLEGKSMEHLQKKH